ncbi:MAG: hypothetical protein K1X53_15825 [Candidatus Sumerlaeaceae bacterium]|nr:hypothetical protein [Candidatus Sumerlaeaceae bacterium]
MITVPVPFRLAAAAATILFATTAPLRIGAQTTSTLLPALQSFAQDQLTSQVKAVKAKRGALVVLDARSGAVLAMAGTDTTDSRRDPHDLAVSEAIEPGSVAKAFSYAAVFEAGAATPDSTVDCERGKYEINGRTIVDAHSNGKLSARDAFAESSNIGAAKMAQLISSATLHQQFTKFGFGTKVGNGIPQEDPGQLLPLERWSAQTALSLAIGYELRATALQMATAMACYGNGGRAVKPVLDMPPAVSPTATDRIVSEETAARMLDMLQYAVEKGTGKPATLTDWTAGGKTGTSRKSDSGTDKAAKYVGTFCGLAPIPNPRIAVCVWIDEPGGGEQYYGGTTAAPVFKAIATEALKLLGEPENKVPAGRPTDVKPEPK